MSFSLAGDQFVENPGGSIYTVSDIPSGYVYDSIELPDGWGLISQTVTSPTTDDLDIVYGIGSGTIVVHYINAGNILSVYLDVYCAATRMGEEIMRAGTLIPVINPLPVVAFCEDNTTCFSLLVLADPNQPTEKLNNDKTEFYFYGNAAVSGIVMTLQRFQNGAFEDIEILIDSSYGSFCEYGKSPDFLGNNFTDDFLKKYTGIFLDWLLVFNDYGAGRYKMKVERTDVFSGVTTFYSKAEYCLKQYQCYLTEGTIRIETLNQGLRGTLEDMANQIDYSTGWYGMIRLRGTFKQIDPAYNKEYNQYGDAEANAYKPYVDEQIPKYRMQIKSVPGFIDWYISTNVLQADRILITDYNPRSRHPFVQVPVKDGTFKIIAEDITNPLASIECEFAYGQNNLRRRNS